MSERETMGGATGPTGAVRATTRVELQASGGIPAQPTPAASQGGQGGGGSMDQAKQQAGQAAGAAMQQAGQAVDTVKQQAGQVAEQASTKADAGLDAAAGGLDKAADMLRERGQSMGGQGGVQTAVAQVAGGLDTAAQYLKDKDSQQLMTDLEALVRRKPTQTLLGALGVGFLLSKIVR